MGPRMWLSGSMLALDVGYFLFDTRSSHTKDLKNGTCYFPT